jgi:hypothetical protein
LKSVKEEWRRDMEDAKEGRQDGVGKGDEVCFTVQSILAI